MQANFDEILGFSGGFRRNITRENHRNFMTPIVSFRVTVRAIIRTARTFEAKFRAIFQVLLEISLRFFERTFGFFLCSIICNQCFAERDI